MTSWSRQAFWYITKSGESGEVPPRGSTVGRAGWLPWQQWFKTTVWSLSIWDPANHISSRVRICVLTCIIGDRSDLYVRINLHFFFSACPDEPIDRQFVQGSVGLGIDFKSAGVEVKKMKNASRECSYFVLQYDASSQQGWDLLSLHSNFFFFFQSLNAHSSRSFLYS